MRWAEIKERQPRLAALGQKRLIEPGVALIATIRRDGTPRLSPVEPFIMDGGLLLSMLWGSRKAADLIRDPRTLVHSIVTSRDGGAGEFKLRGSARAEESPDMQQRYADSVAASLGWRPTPGRFHLFRIDIDDVVFIRYDDATGAPYVAGWPPGREFVRRGTSATSVGPAEPRHDLIV
ncbi:MAG: hypothetical protein M3O55_04460 [Actinomycetota bacterium]|nr:hypothetical protein [Actinomycetota bacterium]